MRTITLEEHFATPGFLDGPGLDLKNAALKFEGRATRLIEALCDIGDKRIAEMDAAGIDMQVLSLTSPGTEQRDAADAIALSREVNDFLAAGVKTNPKRFAGFATLPTAAPDKAAAELETRMRAGGFIGAVINGHNRGRYLDDKFFWPILECAEKLKAPIHIHPTRPPQAVIDASYSGFSPLCRRHVRRPRLGLAHRDRGSRHPADPRRRLRSLSGLAARDRPSGRGLPFMFPRLDNMTPASTKLKRPISAYLRENVYYTSPASISRPPSSICCSKSASTASCSRSIIPTVHGAGAAFLEHIPVCAADRERIAHGNAEKLFGF